MALPSVDYAALDPAADVLHRVVRGHLQTFLAEAAHLRDGEGVPRSGGRFGIFALFPAGAKASAKVRVFLDFLVERFSRLG